MAMILVAHEGGSTYRVTVNQDGDMTTHVVTLWPSDIGHYAPSALPEELIEASFEFLLEREPKESIQTQLELPVIEHDFPEYAQTMRSRFP